MLRRPMLLCGFTCLLSPAVMAAFSGSPISSNPSRSLMSLPSRCRVRVLTSSTNQALILRRETKQRSHQGWERRIPDHYRHTHRKIRDRSSALWSSGSRRLSDVDNAVATTGSSGRRLVRIFRKKRWILFLLVCLVAMLWPSRSASAAGEAAAAAASSSMGITDAATAIAATGYASNPPVSTLKLSQPVSAAAEIQLTARLVHAAFLGAIIGKERSGKQHHPAGVRTMSLVATGAACFTVCSMYGFSSVGRYDPSRMASNVASGVGFIGAGVITTTGAGTHGTNEASSGGGSIVHGLTTAAAIWLSAAVGVGCGVGMCILSTTAALLTLSILRIGRFAQKIQEKEWRLTELRKIRRQRDIHNKPKLKLMRPELIDGSKSSSSSSMLKQSHIKKHHDSKAGPFSNSSDCVFEEKEDQLVFVDQRPPMGWNDTDKMDA